MPKRFFILFFTIFFIGTSIVYARTIHFARVDWQVKGGGPWGPGPNYWSDSEQSVWVDDLGRLHLKIRKENGIWYCAEVNTVDYTTYGEHRFLVEGQIDQMDKNLVLGLFVYADDTHEIDIEYAKWGDPFKEDVGSYTVQPYTTSGNQHSFVSPLDSAKSTHFFNWQADQVSFSSIQGLTYDTPPSQDAYIEQWTYTGSDIPANSDNLHTHLNLWLMNGLPPTDLSVTEVIISDVVQPLTTSSLQNQQPPSSIKNFSLMQNYPNPFNATTTISYQLSGTEQVRLTIYNTLGQVVTELVNKTQKAGNYRALFDASGRPGGLYFYRLRVGNHSKTGKMISLP